MKRSKGDLWFSITKKDLEITHFASGGPGGQHANKVATGARVRHKESGAVSESREFKSQLQNTRAAMQRMVETPKFKLWLAQKDFEYSKRESTDKWLERMLKPWNIRVEVKNEDDEWEKAIDLED